MTNEELAVRIQAGERELLADLWERTQSTVRLLAYRYQARMEHHAFVDIQDLLQCGFLAIVQAVREFKPEKEVRFVTYIKRTYRSEVYRLYCIKATRKSGVYKRKFPEAPSSLNVPVHDDNETDLIERLVDDVDVPAQYEEREIKRTVAAAIRKLEPREQLVIRGRYFQEKTRRQMVDGFVFHDDSEVIRQENSAMRKLRKDPTLQALYYAHYYSPKPPAWDSRTPESVVLASAELADWMGELFTEMEV